MSDISGKRFVRAGRIVTTIAVVLLSVVSFLKFGNDPEILQQISKNPVFALPLIGLLAWSGIYLRDQRLWKLVPIRRKADHCYEQNPHGLE